MSRPTFPDVPPKALEAHATVPRRSGSIDAAVEPFVVESFFGPMQIETFDSGCTAQAELATGISAYTAPFETVRQRHINAPDRGD